MSGKAVTCQRIKMRDAEECYKMIEQDIKEKYPNLELCPIGSLGKKDPYEETGDIDIAVVIDSKEELKDILKDSLGTYILEMNMNTTPKIMSIGYFYEYLYDNMEKPDNLIIQVDFMLVNNLDWAKWRFQSPDLKNGESKYKADPKVFLQSYMVSAIPIDMPIEYFEDGETIKTRFKYTLNQEGLIIQKLNYLGKRGKPIKNPTRELYKFVTNNPNEIMHIIFPKWIDKDMPTYFHSVEKLWEALHKYSAYGEDYIYAVEKRFYDEYINNERSECKLPPEEFPCMYYQTA